MSIKVMTYIWEHAPVSAGALLVLLALADFANDKGWAWPAIETLALKSRLSPRQVQRVLRELEATGAIRTGRNQGPYGANLYQVMTGGDNLTGVTSTTPGGDAHVTQTVIGTVIEDEERIYISSSSSKRAREATA